MALSPIPPATDVRTADVVVVGGGPAGLTAAAGLAPHCDVVVLERESEAGGIPRHSDHPGYGIRDLRTFIGGPAYAARLRRAAAGAGVLTNATVTGWADSLSLDVTSPDGRFRIDARAVVLATGARERPRTARMVPGDRAAGVLTTGQLQNLVHLKHRPVGQRAVVVGAELVSWSAVLTLKHAGCATALVTTEYPRGDAYRVFTGPGQALFGTRLATRTRLVRIIGRPRVEAVELEDLDTGLRRTVPCDTVVLTGDWIPDNELARAAGLPLGAHRGPVVDTRLRTSRAGVFAIGNVLHPVDTADIAALDGAAVVPHVLAHLGGAAAPAGGVAVTAEAPLRWVTPGLLRPGDPAPPRHRLLSWVDTYVPFPRVVVRQGGRVVARRRLAWPAAPGRVFRIPSSVLDGVDRTGGPVTIGLG